MSNVLAVPAVTDGDFAAETARGAVAVEFTARWCGPCRMMAPVVERLAQEYEGRMRVVQMDTDDNPATMARLGVRSVPTMLVLRDGTVVERIIGATTWTAVREHVDRALAL
jgi:thioredoxin 1